MSRQPLVTVLLPVRDAAEHLEGCLASPARQTPAEYEQELEVSCRKRMNYLAQLADKAGVKNRTALLRGACHSAILREQMASKADLLVMGAFRASTARRDLMAHEKQLIIDEIPCPVLLVR